MDRRYSHNSINNPLCKYTIQIFGNMFHTYIFYAAMGNNVKFKTTKENEPFNFGKVRNK